VDSETLLAEASMDGPTEAIVTLDGTAIDDAALEEAAGEP
jgi:hypothetical protein